VTNLHPYKLVAVDRLVPFAKNPRLHSGEQIEQLRASIREFGFTNPLLIDEDGGLIAGHGRLLAAQAEGLAELPAIEVRGLSAAQRSALVVADNQHALTSSWDVGRLTEILADLKTEDYDLSVIGFSLKELDQYLPEPASFPELPEGDRAGFQEMTFVLSDPQVETVKAALRIARGGEFDGTSDNRNGSALAAICAAYPRP
jgi:ParB-like chromosome segregation protein Spo0J